MKNYLKLIVRRAIHATHTPNKEVSIERCVQSYRQIEGGANYCKKTNCVCPFDGELHTIVWQNGQCENKCCEILVAYKKGHTDGMCEMENRKMCEHFCTKKADAIYGMCKLTRNKCISTQDECMLNKIYNNGYNEGLSSKEPK